jgi:hypothetical protein
MNARPTPKSKKSFTLSHSSVAFLERLRKQRKVASTSQVLDDLIRAAAASQRRKSTEDAISAYYTTLSEGDRRDQQAWGDFAAKQIPSG